MRLASILSPSCIVLDVAGATKREILSKLAAPIAADRADISYEDLLDALVRREEASSTAIADGIAIPHAKITTGNQVICCFGRSREGVEFESVDGRPTTLFFVLVSPAADPSLHVQWLSHIAGLLSNGGLRRQLLEVRSPEQVLAALEEEESVREARA
ncbi:MAG TPA: PTS sugar transporter subunit IIA [Candidatus Limnocylindrales bacterium]|nr:PTS sugar transporter subunit IIA [Candidatus Limnocylindrales bacterium]